MRPVLTDIDAVSPGAYNPRQTDPARLALLELSLRKLGFLIPLYATPDGELSSGHQRLTAAIRLGARQIPVCFLERSLSLDERRSVNLIFNRGTNDLSIHDTSRNLTNAIERSDVHSLAAALPDKKPDTPEFYPCLDSKILPIAPLLKVNRGRWISYATNIARTLRSAGVVMPLIITPDLKVVNGLGRLEMQAERGADQVEVVIIPEADSDLARIMLNLLTMDFDITRYADFIRHNSFRRARTASNAELGYGFTFALMGNKRAKEFSLSDRAQRLAWERLHGNTILDFGAGRLKEVTALRAAGFEVSYFEPYQMVGDVIDYECSILNNRAFLAEVAAGKAWSSIFLSAVLNSVPFPQDRIYIAAIVAALCGQGTLYASANSIYHHEWQNINGRQNLDPKSGGAIGFRLDYEPGVKIGDLRAAPKVQKYHTMEEFIELFSRFFWSIRVDYYNRQVVTAICRNPKPVDPALLREALLFEFSLPYPGGRRMGLGEEARRAFGQRLGMAL